MPDKFATPISSDNSVQHRQAGPGVDINNGGAGSEASIYQGSILSNGPINKAGKTEQKTFPPPPLYRSGYSRGGGCFANPLDDGKKSGGGPSSESFDGLDEMMGKLKSSNPPNNQKSGPVHSVIDKNGKVQTFAKPEEAPFNFANPAGADFKGVGQSCSGPFYGDHARGDFNGGGPSSSELFGTTAGEGKEGSTGPQLSAPNNGSVGPKAPSMNKGAGQSPIQNDKTPLPKGNPAPAAPGSMNVMAANSAKSTKPSAPSVPKNTPKPSSVKKPTTVAKTTKPNPTKKSPTPVARKPAPKTTGSMKV